MRVPIQQGGALAGQPERLVELLRGEFEVEVGVGHFVDDVALLQKTKETKQMHQQRNGEPC